MFNYCDCHTLAVQLNSTGLALDDLSCAAVGFLAFVVSPFPITDFPM